MNTIQGITTEAGKIKELWSLVFASNDPFCDPFLQGISSRLLLYPTYGYYLEETQYQAFAQSVQAIGEDAFFVSEVEYAGDFFEKGQHWRCACPTYDEYRNLPLVLENAVFSTKGSFGMLLSHEDHAIVGGTTEFIESMRRNYPHWQEDRERIQADWNDDMAGPVLSATEHAAHL